MDEKDDDVAHGAIAARTANARKCGPGNINLEFARHRRTDIWAFGCVLYECLAGKKAFAVETVAEIVASILRNDPDWTMLAADTPPSLRTVLRRCLQKDPALRLHDIADARIELSEPKPEPAVTVRQRPDRLLVWGGYALAIVAVAGLILTLIWQRSRQADLQPAPVHSSLPPPAGYAFGGGLAVSPDGSKLAAVISDASGTRRLWVRSLSDPMTETILPETDGAEMPFWSADSNSIGFFTGGKLRAISATAGLPRSRGRAMFSGGGTWNVDDGILYCPDLLGGLLLEQGGSSRPVTRLRQEDWMGHFGPQFLPDGLHFLFTGRDLRADTYSHRMGSGWRTKATKPDKWRCGLPGSHR